MSKPRPTLGMYHISFRDNLAGLITPRQPDGSEGGVSDQNHGKEEGYPEHLPERISFSPTIQQCFSAIYPNISHLVEVEKYPHLDFYVYAPIIQENTQFIDTATILKEVWDAHVTGEICVTTPVEFVRISKIRVWVTDKEIRARPYNSTKHPMQFVSPVIRYQVLKTYR